jgi:hypothetical protein
MAALVFAWPGAIAIGVSLGLLGSGGSILTVPLLVYLLGQPEKLAIAGSLAIVGTIAAAGSLPYVRSGLVRWRAVLLFGPPGMAGTFLGAWLAVHVSGAFQLTLFSIVMLAAAVFMLRPIALDDAPVATPRPSWTIVLNGLSVGVVTGLVGVGGGFLIVPALVLLGGLAMREAVATSLVIIALQSASGFYKYQDVLALEHLELNWHVIALVALLGIGGSFAGNVLASRIPQPQLRRVFGLFLITMGVLILSQAAPDMLHN